MCVRAVLVLEYICVVNVQSVVQEWSKVTTPNATEGSQVLTELLKDCGPFSWMTGNGGPGAEYDHEFERVWDVDQGEDHIVDVQCRLHKRTAFWEHELKATNP